MPQQAGFTPYATPLHEAVAADDGEAVQQLLGAATNKRALAAALDEHGNTAMALAAIQGKEKAARGLLIVAPETAAKKNSLGATPLFLAAQNGHEGVVDLLLRFAPDTVSVAAGKVLRRATPAHAAAALGWSGVLKRLLKARVFAAWDEDMDVRIALRSLSKGLTLQAAVTRPLGCMPASPPARLPAAGSLAWLPPLAGLNIHLHFSNCTAGADPTGPGRTAQPALCCQSAAWPYQPV